MPAYFVFNYTVNDADKYNQYRDVVGSTLSQYGGKVLVATGDFKIIEGEPQSILIVLEFESREAAQIWYDSDEYAAIKHLRIEASSDGWSVLADQL